MRAAGRRILLPAALLAAATIARADDPPSEPAPAPEAPEAAAAPLDAQIAAAIEKGVAFLRSQQRASGTWGDIGTHSKSYKGTTEVYQYPIGPTSLALYALLKCDVPPTDPAIKNGFAWLKKAGVSTGTTAYEVSAALLAVTAVADPFKKTKDGRAAGAKVRLVGEWRDWATTLQGQLVARRSPRGWRYEKNSNNPGGPEDVSSTQLAVLALASADRCGVTTDPAVFADAAAYVLTLQEAEGPAADRAVRPRAKPRTGKAPDDGYAKPKPPEDASPKDRARGFRYSVHATADAEDKTPTGARTACGVGALALARWALDGPDGRAAKKGPRPSSAEIEQSIYDGLAWLATNWSPWDHPRRNVYYLYCVERALDLTGAERLGDHLWYLEMVEQLLPRQHPKGFWDTKDEQVGDRNPVVDTSLALLFLRRAAKGGVPVPIVTGDDDEPPVENR